jgi:hypothetical protein
MRRVVTSHPVAVSHRARSAAWCRPVGSHHHCSCVLGQPIASGGWLLHLCRPLAHYVGLNGHYGACQACAPLTGHCSTDTREPCCTAWASGVFLLFCGPWPSSGHMTRGSVRALSSRVAGFGAAEYVAGPESSSAGRRGSELRDMWRGWRPHQQGGGVRSCGTRGGVGVLLSREAGFGTTGSWWRRGPPQ